MFAKFFKSLDSRQLLLAKINDLKVLVLARKFLTDAINKNKKHVRNTWLLIRNISTKQRLADLVWNLFINNLKNYKIIKNTKTILSLAAYEIITFENLENLLLIKSVSVSKKTL